MPAPALVRPKPLPEMMPPTDNVLATTVTVRVAPRVTDPAPAPVAKPHKHHGLLDKHQLAEISHTSTLFGVVTGIPMEFEFGTNWARFSRLSGGVIGQPLAMEGVFSFFLESAFLGLFLYGEKRISKLMHWFSAVMVFVGSWISGFFIIVTDAWM